MGTIDIVEGIRKTLMIEVRSDVKDNTGLDVAMTTAIDFEGIIAPDPEGLR